MLALHLFGPPDLSSTNEARRQERIHLQPKRLALLAYLAAATPQGRHHRETLLALLWPEFDEQRGRAALRQAIHGLRRILGRSAIVSYGDEAIALRDLGLYCDVIAFRNTLTKRRHAAALEIYRGDFMTGFYLRGASIEFERWQERTRRLLREEAAAAALWLSERQVQEGRLEEAVRSTQRALSLSDFDEILLRRLVTLYERLGDSAEAFHAHRSFVRRLHDEFQIEPSAETEAAIESVRRRVARPDRTPETRSAR